MPTMLVLKRSSTLYYPPLTNPPNLLICQNHTERILSHRKKILVKPPVHQLPKRFRCQPIYFSLGNPPNLGTSMGGFSCSANSANELHHTSMQVYKIVHVLYYFGASIFIPTKKSLETAISLLAASRITALNKKMRLTF